MNAHRALRRSIATAIIAPALILASCSAAPDDDGNAGTGSSPTAGGSGDADGAGSDSTAADPAAPSPTRGASDSSPSSAPSSATSSPDAQSSADAETINADAIQFKFAGTEMLCWTEGAEGGGEGRTIFGCQAGAGWKATEGNSPASVLMFKLDDDGSPGEIKAIQANAPVTAWEIQRVQAGGRYLLGNAIIDLTDRERLTFTVGAGDDGEDGAEYGNAETKKPKSGWITVDDYGWAE